MHVQGSQLVRAIPFVCDCCFICLTCLIVQHLIGYCNPTVLQTFHDCVVCRDAVLVVSCLESFDEYHIGLVMVCHHDVLVSALITDEEACWCTVLLLQIQRHGVCWLERWVLPLVLAALPVGTL